MSAAATPDAALAEVRRTLALLAEPGGVIELRALHVAGRRRTDSGYFRDLEKASAAAAALSGRAPGVYVTLNAVDP